MLKQDKDSLVLESFRKKKVLVVEQIARFLECSIITARRRLKQWRAYTSYNRNARYYVLPEIPRFDKNGLWGYKNIFFSRHGNLGQTVIQLVNNSQAGLTTMEIEGRLDIPLKSFLSHFYSMEQLRREIVGNRFVYFSSDEKIFARQKQKRQEAEARARLAELPRDAEAIDILVERIKHPGLSIKQLSVRLRKKGHRLAPEVIRNFFAYHGILKKKWVHHGKSIKRTY